MSVLDALDATRICARWSQPLADPQAWATPAPVPARERPAAPEPVDYSWWALARNPNALLVTGMISTVLMKDAMLRVFAAPLRSAARGGAY
ncbi:MAG TPA: hypothetical protein VFH38_12225 [Jatrophihabitans sp.]|nr:hypothetical protein [Jatrophihabitans sp.]